jgi:hypothetical protein
MTEAPLHRLFDLGELTQAGSEIAVSAGPGELKPLAEWLDVEAVKRLSAAVTLTRLSQTRFSYAAELIADVVQSCVVTLEPIETHIVRPVARELHLVSHLQTQGRVHVLAPGEEDGPEEIDSPRYDLCAPLLEELALAIDPYPRKQGVEFALPAAAGEPPQSPFAALKDLKTKG